MPIAFAHVLLRDRGAEFQPGYEAVHPETGARTHHWLRDEPLYVAAVRSAERWAAREYGPGHLLPVFGRSAEWDVIRQFRRPDGGIGGVWLTEPLLVEYTEEPSAEPGAAADRAGGRR